MLPEEQRIRSKQQLRDWLDYELKQYPGGISARFPISEGAILRRHQILLRKTEYHINCRHKLRGILYKVRLKRFQCKYALHVPANVCAKGLKLMHVGTILVNSSAVIGEDCVLHVNTAVVAGGTDNRAPVLGKGVILGIGSVVLGGVRIADYTAIGANAVVNKDVTEENIAVAGVPAKKISNNGRREWNKEQRP